MDGERELRGSAMAKSSGHCHHLSTPRLSSVWLLLRSSHPYSQEQSVKGFTVPKTCWNNPQIRGLLFTGAWSLNVSYHSQDPIKRLTPSSISFFRHSSSQSMHISISSVFSTISGGGGGTNSLTIPSLVSSWGTPSRLHPDLQCIGFRLGPRSGTNNGNRTAAAVFMGAAIWQMAEMAYKNMEESNNGDEDFQMDMIPDLLDLPAPPISQVHLPLICLFEKIADVCS